MPIRPENKARYPENWKELRGQILTRADHACECKGQCGNNHWQDPVVSYSAGPGEWCRAENHQDHPVTGSKVVLTIAHLDHQPENNKLSNLMAMCQRCHNTYDAPNRTRNQRANQDRASGQELLPYGLYLRTRLNPTGVEQD